jgi:hypothetical protein
VPACRLEDADRPEHVDLGILDRPFDGDADIRLGREMEHRLRSHLVEESLERIAHVVFMERGRRGDVLPLPVDE